MRKGIAASKGYAIGKVFLKEQDEIVIAHRNCIDVIEEKKRLKRAVEEAIPTLLEYGLDEFSVSVPSILRVKEKIINS